MTKLYVGNLPFGITDQQLMEMFSKFGKVDSAAVIMDKFSGKSKGFGFVELENDESAQKAIKELNGVQMDGRNVTVSVARPKR
ncbi:MAG: RNA-binding protein [Patescibacteria group bacterium]|nr:RNA-binding protein [Patescibacteria group bacterium]